MYIVGILYFVMSYQVSKSFAYTNLRACRNHVENLDHAIRQSPCQEISRRDAKRAYQLTIFVAVPALSLVLPVTTSGPVKHSIEMSQNARSALGHTHDSPTVAAPTDRACFKPPRTYGVRPDDAMPTRTSVEPSGGDNRDRSTAPVSSESSAPSTAFRIA